MVNVGLGEKTDRASQGVERSMINESPSIRHEA